MTIPEIFKINGPFAMIFTPTALHLMKTPLFEFTQYLSIYIIYPIFSRVNMLLQK